MTDEKKMTDKEIEQAARWCISHNSCVDCIAQHEDSCSGTFAEYIARNANKEPMIRDIPDYKEDDKSPTGVEVLAILRKALEEHYKIEIMSLSAAGSDAQITFAVNDLPYSVSFEGG
jgi:hypothetical protein